MASLKPEDERSQADEIEIGSDEREFCPQSPSNVESEQELEKTTGTNINPSADRKYASDNFFERITTMIPEEEVEKIISQQKDALAKFEKANETFGKFNELSEARFQAVNVQFKNNTKMLLDMKKDLDSIFRRIRMLKVKLGKQHEEAFAVTEQIGLNGEEGEQ